MSNNKKQNNSVSYNNKKNIVLEQNRKKKLNPILIGTIIFLVAVIAILIFNSLGAKKNGVVVTKSSSGQFSNTQPILPTSQKRAYTTVDQVDGLISLDTSLFNDGQAKYFSYRTSGKIVNFFILKSSDNVIRAAFDSCDVCYAAKKGYRQKGDMMVCNNCGQQFPSGRINDEKGGCNPAPLERNIVSGKLVINVSDIESGLRFF